MFLPSILQKKTINAVVYFVKKQIVCKILSFGWMNTLFLLEKITQGNGLISIL
jgi:hypothetical protein